MKLFPFNEVRPQQDILMDSVKKTITTGGNLLVHAPTGLGKTAGVLAPAIEYAIETGKKIIFLTSRNTQHKLIAETIRLINKKKNLNISYASIVGKKWLCLQKNIDKLSSNEFRNYCKSLRTDNNCRFYLNIKKGENLSTKAQAAIKAINPERRDPKTLMMLCERFEVCPYEISILIAKNAQVIITDYQYIFNPSIRQIFLAKSSTELENSIIICDEGHNLPDRLKSISSRKLSTFILNKALSEIKNKKFVGYDEIVKNIGRNLLNLAKELEEEEKQERYMSKEEFIDILNKIGEPKRIIEDFNRLADIVREEQKQSYLGSIADFISEWIFADEIHYARIFSVVNNNMKKGVSISLLCLDPSVFAKPVIESAHSTIIMSGTLLPTSMYSSLLGLENSEELVLKSPFEERNRKALIIPYTSTKFMTRNNEMYERIANILSKTTDTIKGNSAVFFPSYYLLEKVFNFFHSKKEVVVERQALSKEEKEMLISNFKSKKNEGAVLFAVIRGNFGEGIDLPGDFLNGVIIVGLPLDRPTLETRSLIDYYDAKFGKGWDYGYIFPAFNRIIQSAGRCIRTESDRGVIIFLDERYAWSKYRRLLNEFMNIEVPQNYEEEIKEFFSHPL